MSLARTVPPEDCSGLSSTTTGRPTIHTPGFGERKGKGEEGGVAVARSRHLSLVLSSLVPNVRACACGCAGRVGRQMGRGLVGYIVKSLSFGSRFSGAGVNG